METEEKKLSNLLVDTVERVYKRLYNRESLAEKEFFQKASDVMAKAYYSYDGSKKAIGLPTGFGKSTLTSSSASSTSSFPSSFPTMSPTA